MCIYVYISGRHTVRLTPGCDRQAALQCAVWMCQIEPLKLIFLLLKSGSIYMALFFLAMVKLHSFTKKAIKPNGVLSHMDNWIGMITWIKMITIWIRLNLLGEILLKTSDRPVWKSVIHAYPFWGIQGLSFSAHTVQKTCPYNTKISRCTIWH